LKPDAGGDRVATGQRETIMAETTQFYINGAWVAPAQPNEFPVIDPSTEEVCATISLGGKADTDAAVAAAKAAFDSWSQTDPAERIAAVERIYAVYEKRAEDLAVAISKEMGAPIEMSRSSQVTSGTWHLDGFLRAAKDFQWEHPLGDWAPGERILHQPIGVCALITPWNWPMNQIVLKVIPAILAGCTMVLKPSEIAPLSGLIFAEIVDEAGLPPGVFNMVNGDGPGVGSQLSAHPDVDMVSFTGSTRAGRLITKAAGRHDQAREPGTGRQGRQHHLRRCAGKGGEVGCHPLFPQHRAKLQRADPDDGGTLPLRGGGGTGHRGGRKRDGGARQRGRPAYRAGRERGAVRQDPGV
jgi:delta 1-pyrroline-5-carboxylate dehydrogenase